VTGRVPPAVVVLFAALVGLTSPDSFVAWRRKALPPRKRSQSTQVLDLLAEDDRLNVYAGELEVRPLGAPTTEPHEEAIDRL